MGLHPEYSLMRRLGVELSILTATGDAKFNF